jgi:hypothetical protein
MKPTGLTHEKWQAALKAVEDQALGTNDPAVLTVREFCGATGIRHRDTGMLRLKAMLAAGLVERAKKLVRRADGAIVAVNGYRLLAQQKQQRRR